MRKWNLSRALILFVSLLSHGVTHSDERILSYHSDISVARDATMTVDETIRVRAEGLSIRRGIYRDFPTDYTDQYGNRFVVDFVVLSVTRDGSSEAWHTEKRANGVRVYAGSANALLPNGEYSYTIRYHTNRQIGYFEDHDELYWNVTGNGWDFPIDVASATVRLPGSVAARDIAMEGYMGRFGETGQEYTVEVSRGEARIRTSRGLASREGLTLVASWPKGVVAEPDWLDRLGYLLKDNLGLLLALITLLVSALYLYLAWSRYGRDPSAGVIFAHYEPPEGYSPASARYISKMGYDSKALSAAVINLAVKGHLSIAQDDDDYSLLKESSTEELAPGESILHLKLFSDGSVLELDNKNHKTISKARSAHRRALKRDYQNKYFFKNTSRLLPSFLGSLTVLIVIIALGAFTPLVVVAFSANVALHIVFLWLMKAPTHRGRELLDKLEGFELYLKVAEKDDLNLRHPPDMTPQLFEQYLPFAVALGVEQEWAEQFTGVFAALQNQPGGYQPRWYHGDFNHRNLDGFASDVGSGFTSAISSAGQAPGSSSGGGGGGSSGGGGGGGGGGGW